MKENENLPQDYAEMIRAAQEQAVKLAQEQIQASLSSIQGVQMPDMNAMMQLMQEVIDTSDLLSDSWEINRKDETDLNREQLYMMAFGAPLFVYNSEFVNVLECTYDAEIIKDQMKDWWGIKDHDTTLEIVQWLLNEGHHDKADVILRQVHNNIEEIPAEAADKAEDVYPIIEYMIENEFCTKETLPVTAMAWDLVRVVNVARWTYQCGYISLSEVWEIMRRAAYTATHTFSSWEEYGKSFALGRGVWHGNEEDCEAAQEIVDTLLKDEASPWKQLTWNQIN